MSQNYFKTQPNSMATKPPPGTCQPFALSLAEKPLRVAAYVLDISFSVASGLSSLTRIIIIFLLASVR
jgi:hypothetical protein